MNEPQRRLVRLLLCLAPIILGGLLACTPDQTQGHTRVSPRDFTLLTPLFAASSPWNQSASGAQVLPSSDQQILVTYRVLLGDITDLYPKDDPPFTDWPYMDVSYKEYTIPVFRMGETQADVLICDYEGVKSWTNPKLPIEQEGGPVNVPMPAGTVRPSGPQDLYSDGHLVLYNPDTFMAYDFWQATTVRDGECQSQGGGLTGTVIYEAGMIDFFDTRGPGANPDTYSSARATGTPLLAGMLLPEDVMSGAIQHALALAIPGPRNLAPDPSEPLASDYFYPASTTETDYYSVNPHALAAGQRLRLKQSIVNDEGNVIDEENELAPITRMFLTALRDYGAYVVDNGSGLSFYAEDWHSANLNLTDELVNELIGAAPSAPLPADQTKWQIVLQQLNQDLELIPFAQGPASQTPATADIDYANFDMVQPALTSTAVLSPAIHLPLTLRTPGAPASTPLSGVNDFLYQLQNLDLDAIGASAYDLVILDYAAWGDDESAFSAAQIAALQNSPGGDKIALAYMSIGEAENYRFYWDEDWDSDGDGQPDPGAPAWLDVENPDWEGNYKVHYWDANWRSIVFSYTNRLLEAGFDGAYLDIIDAYEYYAGQGRASAAQEMSDLVGAIRAHARAQDPDFYIFVQNAPELAGMAAAYLGRVDGIGQEDIYYGYENDDEATPPDVSAELEGYLEAFKNAGKLVLTVDYATTPQHVDDAYAKSQAQGYVPFVTVRDLDQLTINPGHEPD